jgi:uncharacterized membrane protein
MDAVEEANPTKPGGPLSGAKGAAAGVAVALLPIAIERVAKLASSKASNGVSELGDRAASKARETAEKATDKVTPDAPKGFSLARGATKKLFGGDDGDDGDGNGGDADGRAAPGHGSGRRMPIQQSVDVAVPIKTAYNQWTQFEDWPRFMHRVESADQVDDATVAFSTKVWGITKRFKASIAEQRPDKRIEWDATEGLSHTGVVTFHRLSDRLTRIEVTVDVEPDSLLEKAGRGMRHAKRAIRGDLHRFKAFVELNEDDVEQGWRGTIEDGDVKRRTEAKKSRSGRSSASGKRSTSGSRSRSGSRSGSRSRAGSSSGSRSRASRSSASAGSRRRTRS